MRSLRAQPRRVHCLVVPALLTTVIGLVPPPAAEGAGTSTCNGLRIPLTGICLLGHPTPDTIPSKWRRSASFESSLTAGTDGWHIASPFVVRRTRQVGGTNGDHSAKIVTHGGDSGCSCARMKFQGGFRFRPRDEAWISGSWLIPDPSKVSWSRLMNLGHWTGNGVSSNWYLALESDRAGTFQVSYAPYGDPHTVILGPRPIPANRWFRVDLHFILSPTDGQALTQWFIDGQLVGQTTRANMLHPTPLTFFNAGLPYFLPGNGNTTVYFDAPRLTF